MSAPYRPWLLWAFCPGMLFWSSFYPLGNASSAALVVILSQFGPGDLGQVPDKGPASLFTAGAGPAAWVWWCGGDAAQGVGNAGRIGWIWGILEEKREVFWMKAGVVPTCSWALSVAGLGLGQGAQPWITEWGWEEQGASTSHPRLWRWLSQPWG